MAEITTNKMYDLYWIAERAGQTDQESIHIEASDDADIKLIVDGVDQEDLDAALAEYIPQHETIIIDQIRHQAKTAIDNAAGRARARLTNGTTGQTEVWQEKFNEATAYLTDAAPPADLSTYPMLRAEVRVTGKDAGECADLIIAERATWVENVAAIEEARRAAKIAIDFDNDVNSVISRMNESIQKLDDLKI